MSENNNIYGTEIKLLGGGEDYVMMCTRPNDELRICGTLNIVDGDNGVDPARLQINGVPVSGGVGVPGAPTNSIQFNQAGGFSGAAGLTYDGNNKISLGATESSFTLEGNDHTGGGTSVTVRAGNSLGNGVDEDAGSVLIQSGINTLGGNGGNVTLSTQTAQGAFEAGDIRLVTGPSLSSGSKSGDILVQSGENQSVTGIPGSIDIVGATSKSPSGGNVTITGGLCEGNGPTSIGGYALLQGGGSISDNQNGGVGGPAVVKGGDSFNPGGSETGGNVILETGTNISAGGSGDLIISKNIGGFQYDTKWPTTIPVKDKVLGITDVTVSNVTLDWVDGGGGGTPGGPNRSIQWNDNGSLTGTSNWVTTNNGEAFWGKGDASLYLGPLLNAGFSHNGTELLIDNSTGDTRIRIVDSGSDVLVDLASIQATSSFKVRDASHNELLTVDGTGRVDVTNDIYADTFHATGGGVEVIQGEIKFTNANGATNKNTRLSTRESTLLDFPVPTFQPFQTGKKIAFDLAPSSSGLTGDIAWIDVCDTPVIDEQNPAVSTVRVGMRDTHGEIGTKAFNAAPKDLHFVVNNNTVSKLQAGASPKMVLGPVSTTTTLNGRSVYVTSGTGGGLLPGIVYEDTSSPVVDSSIQETTYGSTERHIMWKDNLSNYIVPLELSKNLTETNATTLINGIENTIPNAVKEPCAVLQCNSNNQGILVPRLNTAQIASIPSKVEGLIIYNTDTGVPRYWDSTEWVDMAGGGGTGFSINITGADLNKNFRGIAVIDQSTQVQAHVEYEWIHNGYNLFRDGGGAGVGGYNGYITYGTSKSFNQCDEALPQVLSNGVKDNTPTQNCETRDTFETPDPNMELMVTVINDTYLTNYIPVLPDHLDIYLLSGGPAGSSTPWSAANAQILEGIFYTSPVLSGNTWTGPTTQPSGTMESFRYTVTPTQKGRLYPNPVGEFIKMDQFSSETIRKPTKYLSMKGWNTDLLTGNPNKGGPDVERLRIGDVRLYEGGILKNSEFTVEDINKYDISEVYPNPFDPSPITKNYQSVLHGQQVLCDDGNNIVYNFKHTGNTIDQNKFIGNEYWYPIAFGAWNYARYKFPYNMIYPPVRDDTLGTVLVPPASVLTTVQGFHAGATINVDRIEYNGLALTIGQQHQILDSVTSNVIGSTTVCFESNIFTGNKVIIIYDLVDQGTTIDYYTCDGSASSVGDPQNTYYHIWVNNKAILASSVIGGFDGSIGNDDISYALLPPEVVGQKTPVYLDEVKYNIAGNHKLFNVYMDDILLSKLTDTGVQNDVTLALPSGDVYVIPITTAGVYDISVTTVGTSTSQLRFFRSSSPYDKMEPIGDLFGVGTHTENAVFFQENDRLGISVDNFVEGDTGYFNLSTFNLDVSPV